MSKKNNYFVLGILFSIIFLLIIFTIAGILGFKLYLEDTKTGLKLYTIPKELSEQEKADRTVIRYLNKVTGKVYSESDISQSYLEGGFWNVHVWDNWAFCCDGMEKCLTIFKVNKTKVEYRECEDGRIDTIRDK